MKLELEIKMDNAAFNFDDGSGPANGQEVARILGVLADKVRDIDDMTDESGTLRDINDNVVGRWRVNCGL